MPKGWRTSEFWMALATGLFGILVTLGVLTPEMATEGSAAIGQVAGGIIIIVPIVGYIWSRTQVKKPGKL